MANESEPEVTSPTPEKIRLVLQRIGSGYYRQPEVLRQVASRIHNGHGTDPQD